MSTTATRRKARGVKEHAARFSVYLILFVAGTEIRIHSEERLLAERFESLGRPISTVKVLPVSVGVTL